MNCFEQRRVKRKAKWRVHQLGFWHFTYFNSKRNAMKFARSRAVTGGDWLLFRVQRSGSLERVACINRFRINRFQK